MLVLRYRLLPRCALTICLGSRYISLTVHLLFLSALARVTDLHLHGLLILVKVYLMSGRREPLLSLFTLIYFWVE